MAINITDELYAATVKGKLGSAKQVFLDDDSTTVQKAFEDRDEHLDTLDNRSSQMEAAIKDISTTGGASTANAVSYENSTSGLSAVTAQAAIDELSSKKADTTAVDKKLSDGLALKVDKEEGKALIETVIAEKLTIVEEEGYLFAFKDMDNNFLGGIRNSGTWNIPLGIPDESRGLLESLQKQIDEIVTLRNSVYNITEQEGYLLAFTDNKGNFLGGIRKSGQWYIPNGIPEETQKNLDTIYKAIESLNTNLDNEIVERKTLISKNYGEYSWAIANNGTIWLAGTADGKVYMPNGIPDDVQTKLDELNTNLSSTTNRVAGLESLIKVKETGETIAAMVDNEGKELMSIDKNGVFNIINKLVSREGYTIETVDTMADTLYAILDSDKNVIFNITKDKKIQAVNGINFGDVNTGISIMDSQNWLFAIVDANKDVVGGIDKYGAMFANSIQGVCNIKQVENDDWLLAFLDANEHVAFGIKRDGNFFANSVQIDGIPSQEESMTFLYVITDKDNKVLWGIMNSGAVYQPYGMPEEVKANIETLNDKITTLQEDLEYTKEHGNDWSNEKSLCLPIPLVCAKVEINGDIPTSKYIQKTGTLKYSDYLGNSFTKEIMWNTQGNVSSGFDKKNFSVDLYNSIDEDDAFSVKFGDWVAQDGYHLKAYYSDFWKIRSLGVYRHQEQINQSRPYFKRYSYTSLMSTNAQTDDEVLKGGGQEIMGDILSGALCHPDGFPFLLYINDIPWGLYTWNLKKSKENYNVEKNDNDALQMCFGDYMDQVFERYDKNHWQITSHNLIDTTGVEKWDENKDYAIDDVCYDEETFNYEVNGKTSSFTLRRKFKARAASGPSIKTTDYVSTRPSQIGWKNLEVRNPKKTICHEVTYDTEGNKVDSYEYYDYDSPSDYAQTGVYERTHEIISGDEISLAEAQALGFSKKEYNRSVNTRKRLDTYSKSLCIIRGNITVQNLIDWDFVEEFDTTKDYAVNDVVSYNLTLYKFTSAHTAGEWLGTDVATTSGSTIYDACRKQIFDEHHDTDFNIDYFLVMNDCNYYDSITHNTIYTMYDGQHLMAHVYDTDISIGMGTTNTNSFPSVSTGLITGEWCEYLWNYHKEDIKARWKELRDSGVISASNFEKMVWELVNSVGSAAYEEELNVWRDQSSYRNPTYWKMNAGSLQVLEDENGIYHGYDESLNKEVEGYETWDATKQYANGDAVNYNGHSYVANAVPPVGTPPSEAYCCNNPAYGVWDSPRRCIVWFTKRLGYLDNQFSYTANS